MNSTEMYLNDTYAYVFANHSEFFSISREINIHSTFIILIIGIFGHSFTVYVYSNPKFRSNSSNFYMIFLAFIDSAYLFSHMFEDTFRTIKDVHQGNVHYLIEALNIIDRNLIVCRLINYLRNVLRQISAYTIVAFTIQRALVVYKPLYSNFKSKKPALVTFSMISFFSLLLNVWALFLFEIQKNELTQFCDVDRKWAFEYLIINVIYMVLVMLVPIILILILNFLIIFKVYKNDTKRFEMTSHSRRELRSQRTKFEILNVQNSTNISLSKQLVVNYVRVKSSNVNYLSINLNSNDCSDKIYSSKRVTKTLLFVSFSYSCLNIPYVISWFIFFINLNIYQADPEETDFIFSFVQLCETLSVLNYGINFYLYCLSGKLFRDQLKYSFLKCFGVNKKIS